VWFGEVSATEGRASPGRAPAVGNGRGVAGNEDRGLDFETAGISERAGACEERMDLTEKREAVENVDCLIGRKETEEKQKGVEKLKGGLVGREELLDVKAR
jgi:hypothetical protein